MHLPMQQKQKNGMSCKKDGQCVFKARVYSSPKTSMKNTADFRSSFHIAPCRFKTLAPKKLSTVEIDFQLDFLGQHHSQVVEGNWPVLNSNFWVGSQRQVDLSNSTNKNYNSQNSDIDRGEGSYPLHVTHGLNFTQSNLRPDFAKSQSLNEQPNSNGFMYGNQFHLSRQNEANFLAVDSDSDQRHLITSRGLSIRDLQGSGADHQAKASVRVETSVSPVSFDLFGGQQMNHNQSNVPQSLQRQQSGINDMQHLQQQLIFRKMEELQRQQQLQQLDLRQHNFINQVPSFAKQTSASQSTLLNGTPNSDTVQNPWTAELGTNWLNRVSPSMQGSPSELGFPPNLGQTQQFVDLVPQQVDQSLYGVPISSSRGLPANHYNQMVAARSSMPQMSISSNFHQGNQHNLLPDQVGVQDESSISRHKFQNENMLGLAGMRNLGHPQQMNAMPTNAPQQDFLGRQELAGRPEASHEKPTKQVASPQNEVPLDPTEEKILFGSDDNIWAAFAKEPHVSGEADNSFNNGGLSNGLPSIQSGSWSALMQSAVAETSSNDMAPQEEWSGLIFHDNDGPSGSQAPSVHKGSCKQETSLADDNMRMSSALSAGSFPLSDDVNANNAMGSNQLGQKFQNGPGQRLPTEMSQKFFQSSEEAGKWSNSGLLQKSVAEGSQIYRDASPHPLQADRNPKTNSPSWVPGQTTRLQSNGWNALAAMPPGGDRVINNHEAEKSLHSSQNSQVRVMQGEVVHGSSSWKSNSGPSSAIELGHVNSRVGNSQASQGSLSLKDAGISGESSPFVHSNYLLNQWKNAHPPVRSKEGESLGRLPHQANNLNQVLNSMNSHEKDEVARHEMENWDGKENSNDSHRSNLSQHTSGGFREGGLSDVNESQSLPIGKQKSTNQLSRKVSAPRKFQYHPMGNVDEDVEPTYGLKQHTRVQAMSQQNAHFGHVPRNSTVMEKGLSSELQRDAKGPDEEPSRGNLSGPAPNLPVPFSGPIDTYISNKTSSSRYLQYSFSLVVSIKLCHIILTVSVHASQNMLDLLHKVDQSRNHGAMMQFSSSECNASSQLPEAENFDGVGLLQRSQSSVSQGFGLQLGPPSQRMQTPDHSFSYQNGQGTYNSLYSRNDAVEMGDKGPQMVASHSVQSLPSVEETQVEFQPNKSGNPGHGGNDDSMYKMPGNFTSAFGSGVPYSRSNVQNQQLPRVSGESFNRHSSHTARRSAEAPLPDASGSFQQDNLASSGNMSQQSGPNDVQERVLAAAIPTKDGERSSQHFAMPGISRRGDSAQVLHNMWTNVPTHQHNIRVQYHQVPSHIPESPQPHIVESSSAPLMEGNVNSQGAVDGEVQRLKENSGQRIPSVNTDPIRKMKNSLGKSSAMKNRMDDSPAYSASAQNDIEAFGRSLKPNSSAHQSYSLLTHMEASKDAEIDSSNRASKRMKGPENIAEVYQAALKAGQQNVHSAAVGDSLGSSTGVLSEDSKMLGYSRPADIMQRNTSHQGNIASQDTLGLGRDPQVSPQMAPSWFNQYGTLKNGQMLQIYEARNVTPSRPGEPPFTPAKSSSGFDMLNSEEKGSAASTDECQTDNSDQNPTPSLVANGHLPSQSSQLNVTGQHLVSLRPEKRKSATSEFHPWHKEISEGSQDLWTLSMAELDWNKAANRLTEKVVDDAELMEDGPPVLRSKRRLVLTTHLMQQLLRPAPAAILSTDASTSFESLAYTVSRIALGDACSTVSCSSNLDVRCDGVDLSIAKGKSADRSGGRCYEKVTEELMGSARKLENDFLRLDKSASILDLRVECQDLEKFSVINRFARFHGRGQTDNAETTSTDVTTSTQKSIPQRYVTAFPMPRNLPDRILAANGTVSPVVNCS
ncbi:hypothetical protein DH2020_043155 [Rehmannia glutinosa]|uniref:Dentin sialophosphoprotein-like protein n=1 Tax=Rehmannia glutinosa TaxID=99300 RepID=A0ABR0UKG4_REHGL